MTFTIDTDVLYPRTPAERYRIYSVVGGDRRVLASAPDGQSVGLALVTLHEEAKAAGLRGLVDYGRIGVLDCMPDGKPSPKGEWVITPWDRRPA